MAVSEAMILLLICMLLGRRPTSTSCRSNCRRTTLLPRPCRTRGMLSRKVAEAGQVLSSKQLELAGECLALAGPTYSLASRC